jgi:hypothetical protein
MESLAALVAVILLAIYGSGLIAFGLTWSRNRVAMVVTRVFAFVAMATGFWLGFTLMNANGIALGGIPVLLGAASLVISLRRNR